MTQLYHDWKHGQAWAIAPVTVGGQAVKGVDSLLAGCPRLADHTIGSLHAFYWRSSTVTGPVIPAAAQPSVCHATGGCLLSQPGRAEYSRYGG